MWPARLRLLLKGQFDGEDRFTLQAGRLIFEAGEKLGSDFSQIHFLGWSGHG